MIPGELAASRRRLAVSPGNPPGSEGEGKELEGKEGKGRKGEEMKCNGPK